MLDSCFAYCFTWRWRWYGPQKCRLTFSVLSGQSESELLYDWRFTTNQFVLATSPFETHDQYFFLQMNTCGYSPYVTSSLILGSVCRLKFLMGPRQRSHSKFRVPRDSWPHFTVSDSRPPQPGGSGPRIYIPQEQGSPVIPPGTGFPFHRLLWLAGLRWRYSTPPLHGGIYEEI
jgi:hypothetical protein